MRLGKWKRTTSALVLSTIMVSVVALPKAGHSFDAARKRNEALEGRVRAGGVATANAQAAHDRFLAAFANPYNALNAAAAAGNLAHLAADASGDAASGVAGHAHATVSDRIALFEQLENGGGGHPAQAQNQRFREELRRILGITTDPARINATWPTVEGFLNSAKNSVLIAEADGLLGAVAPHGGGAVGGDIVVKLASVRDRMRHATNEAGNGNGHAGNVLPGPHHFATLQDALNALGLD